jgi:MFS family permease
MLLGLTLFGSLNPCMQIWVDDHVRIESIGAGTISCGFAPSMEALIASRAVAGMGGGGFAPAFWMHFPRS